MSDFYLLVAFIGFCLYMLVLIFDRAWLKRGSVELQKCELVDLVEGYWRFNLTYCLPRHVHWGEIKYTLKDKKNPSTVITGKARNLEHAKAGLNSEFLHIKQALTKTSDSQHEWILHVTASSVVDNFNPIYKYLPVIQKKKFKVKLHG